MDASLRSNAVDKQRIADAIEAHLLSNPDWVPVADLAERFQVNERALRRRGHHPGLCSDFTISGDQGLKHIAWSTDDEWDAYQGRIRTHALAELVALRRKRARRAHHFDATRASLVEKDGQQVWRAFS